jgi:hypothetical protein
MQGDLTGRQQAKCDVEAHTLPDGPSAGKIAANIWPPLQTTVSNTLFNCNGFAERGTE